LLVRAVVAFATIAVLVACGGQPPPPVVVEYSATPSAVRVKPLSTAPSQPPLRRPTRNPILATAADGEAESSAVATAPGGATTTDLATVSTTAPTETPTPDDLEDEAEPPSSTAVTAVVTPTISVGPLAGQVPESQGQFVTSNSRSSRYYYAKDDAGWHRIRPDHQVWFATADALLAAFPGRSLHFARGSRSTRTPTPVG
jgi:hypothetical protein